MKNIYLPLAFIVLILMQAASGFIIYKQYEENNRIGINQSILAKGQMALMLSYKKREFKKFEPGATALAGTLGFKVNQIDHYIRTEYHYNWKDTMISIPYLNNDREIRQFYVEKDCITLSGTSYPDSMVLNSPVLKDTTDLFLVREPNKEIFWPIRFLSKNRWVHTAVSVSKCTGDTLSIRKNIKVGDKEN